MTCEEVAVAIETGRVPRGVTGVRCNGRWVDPLDMVRAWVAAGVWRANIAEGLSFTWDDTGANSWTERGRDN